MSDIVIYGRGKTGQSLLKLLQKQGKRAIFYDELQGFEAICDFTKDTTVLLSPGVNPSAKGVILARQRGSKIVSELDYCFPLCKAPCISVTGTNGKTTTCELINHILKNVGKTVHLLGNGGVPFSEKVSDCNPSDVVVLESSSFQLNYCKVFSPNVSLITNLAVDHLDHHKSFGDYALAKQNNFVNQTKNAFAIFNYDDKNAFDLSQKCRCHTLFYSTNNTFANCYIDGKFVYLNTFGNVQKHSSQPLANMYAHNQGNCLGAILACSLFGVTLEQSLGAISTYNFLPHRMQIVAQFRGVTFVDDSKGTNVHATVNACKSVVGNVALILGGSQKGYSFDEIFAGMSPDVRYMCASGDTAEDIANCGKKYGKTVHVFNDIKDCVKGCFDAIKSIGGTVLMSNACASFDKFGSYAERGNYFQRIVEELKIESQI